MPGPACCLLIAAFSSAVVEAAAGADAEVAAGRAPIDVQGKEENSFTFTLVPGLGLRLHSPVDSLTLSYTPRIFYRVPNELDVDRPLVLHQVSIGHTAQLDRLTAWASSAELSVGEIDYTAAGVVFPVGTTQIQTSVSKLLRARGQTGIKTQLTRRLQLTWDASGDYTKSLDDRVRIAVAPTPAPGTPNGAPNVQQYGGSIPDSAQATTQAALTHALDRENRVGVGAEVTYQWFADSGKYLLFSPDLTWDRRLTQRSTLGLSAGLAYVITLDTVPDSDVDSGSNLGGTGNIHFRSEVYRSRRVVASIDTSALLDWYFDPVAGTSQPRAGTVLGATVSVGREWHFTPNLSFYALLRGPATRIALNPDGTPVTGATPEVIINNNATSLRVELPARYDFSHYTSLNFGVRAALRGREIRSEAFDLTEQYEFWAFVGLTVHIPTGHDDGTWLGL